VRITDRASGHHWYLPFPASAVAVAGASSTGPGGAWATPETREFVVRSQRELVPIQPDVGALQLPPCRRKRVALRLGREDDGPRLRPARVD